MRPESVKGGKFVYLLFVDDDRDPCGSAFAFRSPTQNKLLTAGHNLYDENLKVIIPGHFYVSRKIEKDMLGVVVSTAEKIRVEVVSFCCNGNDDWAVLRLSESARRLTDLIEICPQSEIPSLVEEQKFKLYHCPIEYYLSGTITSLEASAAFNWMPASSISILGGIMTFDKGLCKGSSGGLVLTESGKAIAMHISSTNSIISSEDARSNGSGWSKKSTTQVQLSALRDGLDSAANSHSSTSTCLLLSVNGNIMASCN